MSDLVSRLAGSLRAASCCGIAFLVVASIVALLAAFFHPGPMGRGKWAALVEMWWGLGAVAAIPIAFVLTAAAIASFSLRRTPRLRVTIREGGFAWQLGRSHADVPWTSIVCLGPSLFSDLPGRPDLHPSLVLVARTGDAEVGFPLPFGIQHAEVLFPHVISVTRTARQECGMVWLLENILSGQRPVLLAERLCAIVPDFLSTRAGITTYGELSGELFTYLDRFETRAGAGKA